MTTRRLVKGCAPASSVYVCSLSEPIRMMFVHIRSGRNSPGRRRATSAAGCRGVYPVGHGRAPVSAAKPGGELHHTHRGQRIPGVAPPHPLCQLPIPDPAHPQRPCRSLADHPRLYSNVHCTPGSEWLRLTPIQLPKDGIWTAKDDARSLSPWIGLPGFRHTVGMARHWHFLSVLFWVGNGLVFVVLLLGTQQWKRLVPTSWQIVPDAWAVFAPLRYFPHPRLSPTVFTPITTALQQLAYFGVSVRPGPACDLDRAGDVARFDKHASSGWYRL